jgi:hypothetical protein
MGLMDNVKKAQEMARQAAQPGDCFHIKADPDDTSKVMLYGQA